MIALNIVSVKVCNNIVYEIKWGNLDIIILIQLLMCAHGIISFGPKERS